MPIVSSAPNLHGLPLCRCQSARCRPSAFRGSRFSGAPVSGALGWGAFAAGARPMWRSGASAYSSGSAFDRTHHGLEHQQGHTRADDSLPHCGQVLASGIAGILLASRSMGSMAGTAIWLLGLGSCTFAA